MSQYINDNCVSGVCVDNIMGSLTPSCWLDNYNLTSQNNLYIFNGLAQKWYNASARSTGVISFLF